MQPRAEAPGKVAIALVALRRGRNHLEITQAVKRAGWSVVVAASGEAALDQLAAMRPRLIVVDAELPRLADGRHPAVALRTAAPADARHSLVLVATRFDDEVALVAQEAGAARVVLADAGTPGPTADGLEVDGYQLVEAGGAGLGGDASVPADGRELWVIDDSYAIRLLARRAFERVGWWVLDFDDLSSAHAALAARRPPDAVVLDVYLPDGNGLDAVPDFAGVGAAVVMLSNLAGPEQVERAFAGGAADIVSKPVDMRSLVARVQRAVRWTKAADVTGARLTEQPRPPGSKAITSARP